MPLLYDALVPWYRLLDPPEDHRDEVAAYQAALDGTGTRPLETLLELGAGAGHNAVHLKARFRCTLADLSPGMLGLSRALNPECEHIEGDMRTLRLGRTFDAVFIHDAIMYMTSRDDLRAAIATAFVHTRPGGAAVFAPDLLRDTFRESSQLHGADEPGRSLRCLEWTWDPDPGDDTVTTELAFLLRDGQEMTSVHDRHVEGLFPRAVWLEIIASAGYRVELGDRPTGGEEATDEIFVCRRPG